MSEIGEAPAQQQESLTKQPVVETPHSMSYLGVEVPKAKLNDGPLVPDRAAYNDIIDTKASLELKQAIAISIRTGRPLYTKGGSGMGKSTIPKSMAAELGMEVYEIDGHGYKTPDEILAVMKPALDAEPGKRKMLIIHEVNAIPADVLKGVNSELDRLSRSEEGYDKFSTSVLMNANEATDSFAGIAPLSEDLIRRADTYRVPDDLEPSDDDFLGLSLIDEAPNFPEGIIDSSFLTSREDTLSLAELKAIPGFVEDWKKYIEFHKKVKELRKSGVIEDVYGEPVSFTSFTEQPSVLAYLKLFTPDKATTVIPTLQKVLQYRYANKLIDSGKREVEKLITSLGGEDSHSQESTQSHYDEDFKI